MLKSICWITIVAMIIPFAGVAQTPKESLHPQDWKLAAQIQSREVPDLNSGVAGPVAGFAGDKFIIGGGANFPDNFPWKGGTKQYYSQLLVYDLNNNGLELLSDCIQLPENLGYAGLAQDKKGFYAAGGENENGPVNKVWYFTWDKGRKCLQSDRLADLPMAVSNGSLALANGILYFAGGESIEGTSAKMWKLDSRKKDAIWQEIADLPEPASHGVFLNMKNGQLAWVAGRRKTASGISDIYNHLFMYTIAANAWQQKASLPLNLAAGTGAVTANGGILLFGGDDASTFSRVEAALVEIAQSKTPEEKEERTARKNELQENHPGFNRNVYFWNPETNAWSVIGELTFPTPVTTTAIAFKDRVFLPSGEIKAGVRTNNIWMIKL